MVVIRDMLEERVGGGFVYVPMIGISQTGCDRIRLKVQEGTFMCHMDEQLVAELHALHTSFSMHRHRLFISRRVEGKRSGVGGHEGLVDSEPRFC